MKFVQVSSGNGVTTAIRDDGSIYAWGNNTQGALGNGNNISSNVPVRVATPDGVTFSQVSTSSHSLALGSDGNVYAWGSNAQGELGNGTTVSSNVPIVVVPPAGVKFVQVDVQHFTSIALGDDGKVYNWGDNTYGKLGDGSYAIRTRPVQPLTPVGVRFSQIDAGGRHTAALATDGTVYAWGGGWEGQLGNGQFYDSAVPVAALAPAPGVTFTRIDSGYRQTFGTGTDGKIYAWGENYRGELGDGTNSSRSRPTEVIAPTALSGLNGGFYSSYGIGADGKVYAWGDNNRGQIGDGTTTNRSTPTPVLIPSGVNITAVDGGYNGAAALTDTGEIYTWGANLRGQLGNGDNTDSSVPVLALTPKAVITGVTFGGVPSTGLVDNADGTISVVTPAHEAGPVDIVIEWTLDGIAQTPITYAGGFKYLPAPTAPSVTDPEDQTITPGKNAKFTVEATGIPAPSVSWQVSNDAGKSWDSLPSNFGTTVSAGGLTLTIKGAEKDNGSLYRAVASNTSGKATSNGAKLTVIKPRTGGPEVPIKKTQAPSLAKTGDDLTPLLWATGALVLVIGVGLVVVSRLRKRHTEAQPEE